jgi:hypothetical protein
MHHAGAFKSLDCLPVEVLIWRGQSHLLRFYALGHYNRGQKQHGHLQELWFATTCQCFCIPGTFAQFQKERDVFAPQFRLLSQLPVGLIPTPFVSQII